MSSRVIGLSILSIFCLFAVQIHATLPTVESFNYDINHRNTSVIDKRPYAVLVVAFNRPDYLADVIKSLEKNPESQSMPFYFFLDGGPQAKQEESSRVINASSIKNKTIIARNRNYGCPKNHIDSKRFMFDWCGFEKVIVLEEDLAVSPSFIHINLALHAWAKKEFRNVGVVQCWSYCYLTKDQKSNNLNLVGKSNTPWWSFAAYCLDKETWNNMNPLLYEYELFIDQIPHTQEYQRQRSKPATSPMGPIIRDWIRNKLITHIPTLNTSEKKAFPCDVGDTIKHCCFAENFQPNQDIMTGISLWMAGYTKIGTVVNRARHIGEEGITCDKKMFDEHYKEIKLDNFTKRDMNLVEFVVETKESYA